MVRCSLATANRMQGIEAFTTEAQRTQRRKIIPNGERSNSRVLTGWLLCVLCVSVVNLFGSRGNRAGAGLPRRPHPPRFARHPLPRCGRGGEIAYDKAGVF